MLKGEARSSLLLALTKVGVARTTRQQRAFIVHGHDQHALMELKDYLQNTLMWRNLSFSPDQPNLGRTIIEKFEDYSGSIDWVFVLLTPDDMNFVPKTNEEKRRARQNVIFELGFFYGLLGRLDGHIIVLKKGDVELP